MPGECVPPRAPWRPSHLSMGTHIWQLLPAHAGLFKPPCNFLVKLVTYWAREDIVYNKSSRLSGPETCRLKYGRGGEFCRSCSCLTARKALGRAPRRRRASDIPGFFLVTFSAGRGPGGRSGGSEVGEEMSRCILRFCAGGKARKRPAVDPRRARLSGAKPLVPSRHPRAGAEQSEPCHRYLAAPRHTQTNGTAQVCLRAAAVPSGSAGA